MTSFPHLFMKQNSYSWSFFEDADVNKTLFLPLRKSRNHRGRVLQLVASTRPSAEFRKESLQSWEEFSASYRWLTWGRAKQPEDLHRQKAPHVDSIRNSSTQPGCPAPQGSGALLWPHLPHRARSLWGRGLSCSFLASNTCHRVVCWRKSGGEGDSPRKCPWDSKVPWDHITWESDL